MPYSTLGKESNYHSLRDASSFLYHFFSLTKIYVRLIPIFID